MGHYGHKHELKDQFLSHFKRTGIIFDACHAIDISRSTFYRWLEGDTEFGVRLMEAYQVAYKYNKRLLDSVPTHKRHSFAHVINDLPSSG